MEIINIRRSVRSYSNKPVEKEKVELLLRRHAGPERAKSATWHFIVVDDERFSGARQFRETQMLKESAACHYCVNR